MKNRQAIIFATLVLTVTAAGAQAQSGADTYKSKCAMCHAADGSGSTPAGKSMKTPSLLAPDIVSKSDADMIDVTKSGKGKMPAYSGKLTDPKIKDVIAYMRTLQKK